MPTSEGQSRLAVLIDADNTRPTIVEGLFEEIANYGIATVKRIYGDWTGTQLRGWKDVLLQHAIQPIQQFAYTTGKNATDSAMIIDAMDLLFTETIDGFCIVSSDSDFTRLSARIREAGLTVYGFGEQKTPKAFVTACDRFIYTEILRRDTKESGGEQKKKPTVTELKRDSRLVNLLRNAVEDSEDETGWANLGTVGQNVANKAPEFDPRNYGYKKLGELVKAIDLFQIDERGSEGSSGKQVYIRDKRREVTVPEPSERPAAAPAHRYRPRIFDVVAFAIALSAVVAVSIFAYGRGGEASEVRIQSDDGVFIYTLDEPRDVVLRGPIGETTVRIEHGSVWVVESPCRDKLCILAGHLHAHGEWTACLPNRVFLRVSGDDEASPVDAQTY